jgi:hypothetical protein
VMPKEQRPGETARDAEGTEARRDSAALKEQRSGETARGAEGTEVRRHSPWY